MTYEENTEIENPEVENVDISISNLQDLVKECLSIVKTATLKDNEIQMWIKAAILDMKRQGIDAERLIEDSLVRGTIIMFVKANFGITDIKEKEIAQQHYEKLCISMSLSNDYKVVEND